MSCYIAYKYDGQIIIHRRYLQIKRCSLGIDTILVNYSMCLPPCVGCSQSEQKIDRLQEMTAENARRLEQREDTALEYKRYVLGWTE